MLVAENIDLYYGASHILRGVNVLAEKGSVTCVLGRNGVGKTSLLRALVGLQPIRRGTIRWEDREITGLMPQEREIFARLTVQENLATGLAARPRQQRRISDEIFSLFPVLRDMLKRRGGDLSGGQQQQ